jgi:hypothetical protein
VRRSLAVRHDTRRTLSRHVWAQMPAEVRAAVEQRIGPVKQVTPVNAGSMSSLAAILHTSTGDVFCKGCETDHPQVRMHWREARLNGHLPRFVPRLRWQVKAGGWVVNGFDRAPGRHIDVTPGSPDLPVLAATLKAMSATSAPAMVQSATVRWSGRIAPEIVDGGALIHADVTPKNFLVDGGKIAVVDWASPCRGAAWIDSALMVVRLIRAGHTPAEAEVWAAQVPAWAAASECSVTAFAAMRAEHLAERAHRESAVHLRELAVAAAGWAAFRREGAPQPTA